jgi:hypothetical protein
MRLPATLSRRTELTVAFAMFAAVTVITAAFQPQIDINDGKGWDGAAYYTVAQELSGGQALTADAPFVYRVGTPFLASLVDPNNLVLSFKIVNLAANATLTLLLLVWLRLFIGDWRIRLGLIAAFLLQWHGPVRFTLFYPVAADNWFAALLLAGLLVVHALSKRGSWLLIAGVTALAVLGTLVRESGLLLALVVPFARNPVHLGWRLPRFSVVLLLPLAIAAAGFGGLHAMAHLTNTASSPDAGGLIVPKSVPVYALGWWTAFGPLLILPLFTWRRTAAFLWQHQYMLALLGAVTLLSSFQSPALQLQLQDTERYLFWAMPVMYVLIGRALEELLPIISRPLLGILLTCQLLAERAFWGIPQPGGTDDPAAIYSHGSAALLLFTPLGNNVHYFDIFPSWMSQAYRLILLGEYVALGVIMLVWLYWLATRESNRQRALAVAEASSTVSQSTMNGHVGLAYLPSQTRTQ